MSRVHSRVGRGPPFGPELPRSGRVPPLPFFPTSAVCSTRHPAGLLHPASGHGVRHVSGPPFSFARRLRTRARLSQWRSTLRSFPLPSRSVGVTAHRFPLAVGPGLLPWSRSCCHARFRRLLPFPRPQGFVPPRSPLRPAGVSAASSPDAPLGLVPRRVRRYLFPVPLRGATAGRSRHGPKTAGGPPVGAGRFAVLLEGRSCPRPVAHPMARHPEGWRSLASEPQPVPRDPLLQPARWPPEGGCAAGSAVCRGPRVPARRGGARGRTPGGVRPEGSCGSPRGGAVAFITCCLVFPAPPGRSLVGSACCPLDSEEPFSWLGLLPPLPRDGPLLPSPRPGAPRLRKAPLPMVCSAGSGLPGYRPSSPLLRRQPRLPPSSGVTLLARAGARAVRVR
jgi:hypothetical protein